MLLAFVCGILVGLVITTLLNIFIDELDREALGESSDSCPTDNKCPYCGNTWDSKYTNHSTCGLS